MPDWKKIRAAGEQLTISEPIANPYQGELNRFNDLVKSENLDALMAHYPLRESSVLERIAETLRCKNRADYERMVVARVKDDASLAKKLKKRIKPLADLLDAGRSSDGLTTSQLQSLPVSPRRWNSRRRPALAARQP